jgi:hypothetical protein
MTIYIITVICTILVSSAVIFLLMHRSKLLDFKTLSFIMIASLISAVALPGIYVAVFSYAGSDMESSAVAILMAVIFAIFTVIVFILGLAISRIAPRIGATSVKRNSLEAGSHSEEGNYLEQIFTSFIGGSDVESGDKPPNNEDIMDMETNILEKSVDSEENIDKMGIENNIQDGNSMTIEECIEEAFRLKGSGDCEGAILYYMYALDKQPNKELTFWIILDICVLYKSLGLQEMALEILNNYYTVGGVFDEFSKEEIEKNLFEMRS